MRRLSSSLGIAAILIALAPVPCEVVLPHVGALTEEVYVLEAAAPSYPALAAAANVSGTVTVQTHITQAGVVDNVKTVEGHALLRAEAETAARRWKFQSKGVTILRLQFVFSLLPSQTSRQQLLTIFRPPYEVEVKQSMPESIVTSDPKGYVKRGSRRTRKPEL
ncbi:MAG: TonB family protein [Acidobacteriota bacterium]